MGLYDLRCALSGLSLSGAMGPGSFRTAALLLGEVDGRWTPLLPPVGGHYDRYGRVELWGDSPAEAAHASWVGVVLELLWKEGILRSDAPTELAALVARREFGGCAGPFLAHVAESVHGGHRVMLGATRVLPCFYREDVAAEIAADMSLNAAEPARMPLLDAFAPLPAETVDVLARLGRVLRWAERHGGLRPVDIDDGSQHDDADFDRFAREAHRRDPILRRLLDRWQRADMEAQEAWRAFHEPPPGPPSLAFEPSMVDPVLAACGVPLDERSALAAAVASAADPAQVARLLSAAPSENPAMLAAFDGTVERRGDRLLLRNAAFPDAPAIYAPGDLVLVVRDGDQVVAGAPLSEGEVDLHQLHRILGVAERLSEALGALLGLTAERAMTLVSPMLRHARLSETGELVSLARWDAWFDEGKLGDQYCEPALMGYPALLAHVDPSLAAIEASQARRRELARRLEDPDRYYLPRDL
jgi:hypothetical protein